jgi:hypothetical protein
MGERNERRFSKTVSHMLHDGHRVAHHYLKGCGALHAARQARKAAAWLTDMALTEVSRHVAWWLSCGPSSQGCWGGLHAVLSRRAKQRHD